MARTFPGDEARSPPSPTLRPNELTGRTPRAGHQVIHVQSESMPRIGYSLNSRERLVPRDPCTTARARKAL